MKKIRISSGGYLLIVNSLQECPEGEICMTPDEYQWAKNMSAGYSHDPETQKSFWATALDNKRKYRLYDLRVGIPQQEEPVGERLAVTYRATPSAKNVPNEDTISNFPGEAICLEIKKMLIGSGAKTADERKKEYEDHNSNDEILHGQ